MLLNVPGMSENAELMAEMGLVPVKYEVAPRVMPPAAERAVLLAAVDQPEQSKTEEALENWLVNQLPWVVLLELVGSDIVFDVVYVG